MKPKINRRQAIKGTTVAAGAAITSQACGENEIDGFRFGSPVAKPDDQQCLTPVNEFYTVARGRPKPHDLKGEDLVNARMTPESWRLEIVADKETDPPVEKLPANAQREFKLDDESAITFPDLMELAKTKAVKFIKAIQCLNIPTPLGQGLWEGVPLRDMLLKCGKLKNVRRIYYWGFHNNDPKQIFQSSLSYTQVMETAPNELPVFLAFRLNGEPISPLRGGPVRMIVPWAYGFKSIKWLHRITLTNDPRANDTYSLQNNDPDSPLKTAAYIETKQKAFDKNENADFSGNVISGLSGLSHVEYLIRKRDDEKRIDLPYDHPEIENGSWKKATVVAPPANWKNVLPDGVSSKELLGFDPSTGQPNQWPLRYGMTRWNVAISKLQPGNYEIRVRAIDKNGFAQPNPRPIQKSGRNNIPVHHFSVK